jgi:glycosyltransferase involved in cell wall biosynthesis
MLFRDAAFSLLAGGYDSAFPVRAHPNSTRVLHIVPALFGTGDGILGGAERYAFELARSMAEEVPTRLLTFGEREREETVGKLSLRVCGSYYRVRGQAFNPVSPAVVSEVLKADVVHCHQQHITVSSLAAAICRLTRRKVFVSNLGGGGWDISSYISTDRWYNAHLHISEYSRKVFGHSAKLWAHVILGGVDSEKFSPESTPCANPGVVFAGRLLPHKGVDSLIEAMPPDLPLHIIGQKMDDRYYELLRSLAKGKRVEFHHDFSDHQLVQAYRRALCVVLPSVYRTVYGEEGKIPELLGQTLLEGMACGRPVICTDVASMPEIVRDNITGFVVPPNDPVALRAKICWLREHPCEAFRMGHAARQRVLEHFTWHAVVQRCMRIYGLAAEYAGQMA